MSHFIGSCRDALRTAVMDALSVGAFAVFAGASAASLSAMESASPVDVNALHVPLGEAAIEPESSAEYVEDLDIVKTIKSATNVILLARRLERGAASACPGIIPSLEGPQMQYLAAQLVKDNSSHFAIITMALGQPIPADPFIYS